jgi:hypothetical protein
MLISDLIPRDLVASEIASPDLITGDIPVDQVVNIAGGDICALCHLQQHMRTLKKRVVFTR